MPYLNRLTIMGHCGRDAEARSTPSGDTVLTFSVATTEKWKDRAGNANERTTWFRVEKWKAPEWMQGALTKGALVLVEGSIFCEQYEKDGQKREAWKVRADNVLPLAPKGEKPQPVMAGAPVATSRYDDDIPF